MLYLLAPLNQQLKPDDDALFKVSFLHTSLKESIERLDGRLDNLDRTADAIRAEIWLIGPKSYQSSTEPPETSVSSISPE